MGELTTGPVRVLYIAGTGRTGSTLIANLLGQVGGYSSLGEIRYVWERGLLEDRLCGCGARVRECPVWKTALASTDVHPGTDVLERARVQHRLTRMRNVPSLLRERRQPRPTTASHVQMLAALYRGLETATSGDVIVDSSKLPTYALLLSMSPAIDLRIVHVVRDPRAVAHSWQRERALIDGAQRSRMLTQSTWRSAALWDVWNEITERRLDLGGDRYVRIRYEDFAAHPAEHLRRSLALFGHAHRDLPLKPGGIAHLRPTHTVAGNPARMRHGDITVRADAGWRDEMPPWRRAVATVLTLPRLHHHGYRLR